MLYLFTNNKHLLDLIKSTVEKSSWVKAHLNNIPLDLLSSHMLYRKIFDSTNYYWFSNYKLIQMFNSCDKTLM